MCCGESMVQIGIGNGPSVAVQALVVDEDLFGYDLLLGLNAIRQLGGMTMSDTGEVKFSQHERLMCTAITLDESDFHAEYDEAKHVWTASWKWSGDQPPVSLKNRLSEYPALKRLQGEYELELQAWIQNGWLIPYLESEVGLPKGLIPLMAILQESKQKVRPVMDYRELNEHVNAYTANADMCAQTMREWRQQGPKATIVDLRRAYLQIHIDKSLWPFQMVKIKGQRYCVTHLGFRINVAPQIMRSVVKAVIGQDETVSSTTSSYVDDIFVNKSVCSAAQMKTHLERFGLTCKNLEQLSSGARVLGIYVWEEHIKLRWRHNDERPKVSNVLTRCAVFSVCGRLIGYFPVCSWFRVAAAFVKQRANAVTTGWDDKTQDSMLHRMLDEIVMRLSQTDPAHGDWCANGQKVTVWVDASYWPPGWLLNMMEP